MAQRLSPGGGGLNGHWPLFHPYGARRPAFWSADGALSQAEVLAKASNLAAHLSEGENAINYCEDRDHFAVALLAIWLRGRVALLPSDHTARSLSIIREDYGELPCLTDQSLDLPSAINVTAEQGKPGAVGDLTASDALALSESRLAVRVFTSGSTGKPSVNEKTWGMLVAGGKAIPPMVGLDALEHPAIVATVPSQHMYGFELTIMNVLQGGASAHSERPMYPADVVRCLSEVPAPRVLVTTPVHLRALLESEAVLPEVAHIVSATAPLSMELAKSAERRIGAPVWEIYGFTEAGSVAGRRTTAGEAWTLREDFEARNEDGRHEVYWSRFDRRIPFPDLIESLDNRRIRLLGRSQDIVNVAGKRASLSGLSAQLLEVEGVEDGAFYLPAEDKGRGTVLRLAAFVVAPGLTPAEIRQGLHGRMDPAFIPRSVALVDSLGRNATGKLPQSALKRLAEMHLPSGEGNRKERTLVFSRQHTSLEGHFPDHPIVPAVAILAELSAWAEAETGRSIAGVKSARFRSALLPEVEWWAAMEAGQGDTVSITCQEGGRVVMTAKLVLA